MCLEDDPNRSCGLKKATILSEHRFFTTIVPFTLTSLFVVLTLLMSLHIRRMEAVFAWCKGVKFIEVQKLTTTFEGTTIRTLRRLEELIRQITSASKAIGNHELQTKFEKGSELVKRDIVFCSSLYL
mmetsp:Transcript_19866/g.46180  ORF Transcript_19866/g.46180 Transcript_19866/m.46180 type:complete len:127 (-) Transcript_19866:31-411(-)